MRKKINYTIVSLISLVVLLGSCSSNDDSMYDIPESWKVYQQDVLNKVKSLTDETTGAKAYKTLESTSKLGFIHYKPTDYITKSMEGEFGEEGPDPFLMAKSEKSVITQPEFDTDIVVVRAELWYYTESGDKYIVATTEGMNNQMKLQFRLNASSATITSALVLPITDGLKTALMDMEVGEERLVCVPSQLGMGYYSTTVGIRAIIGYSTLFYDVKLLEVKRE